MLMKSRCCCDACKLVRISDCSSEFYVQFSEPPIKSYRRIYQPVRPYPATDYTDQVPLDMTLDGSPDNVSTSSDRTKQTSINHLSLKMCDASVGSPSCLDLLQYLACLLFTLKAI